MSPEQSIMIDHRWSGNDEAWSFETWRHGRLVSGLCLLPNQILPVTTCIPLSSLLANNKNIMDASFSDAPITALRFIRLSHHLSGSSCIPASTDWWLYRNWRLSTIDWVEWVQYRTLGAQSLSIHILPGYPHLIEGTRESTSLLSYSNLTDSCFGERSSNT